MAAFHYSLLSACCSLLISLLVTGVESANIEVPECPPPDYPQWGGYGPILDVYTAGDVIHYFCEVDTYIGGNFRRVCQDTGDWTGETPVCDAPANFEVINQTSTAEPSYENEAENANDGVRSTCSSTRAEPGATWMGTFAQPLHLIRVMIFLPKVNVAYEVFNVRADGTEYSCGKNQRRVERYEWVFHNCLEPTNTNVVAVKIRSLSSEPLQLCEVVTHVLTDPTCVDPHVPIESGRLILTRKTATLVCDTGYRRSRDNILRCIRTGVWERKNLYCIDTEREVDIAESAPNRGQDFAPIRRP